MHFHFFRAAFADVRVSLSFIIAGALSHTGRTKITHRDVFTKFVPIDRTLSGIIWFGNFSQLCKATANLSKYCLFVSEKKGPHSGCPGPWTQLSGWRWVALPAWAFLGPGLGGVAGARMYPCGGPGQACLCEGGWCAPGLYVLVV